MIIKIDHIAISSMNFEKHVAILKSVGYKVVFVEIDINNSQIKCPLIKKFHKNHDLALLNSKDNFNIELINHGHINSNYGYITPLFEFDNISNRVIHQETSLDDIFIGSLEIKDLDDLFMLNDLSKNGFQFNKIVLKTKDIPESIKFWECFGFKALDISDDFAFMKFKSLFDTGECIILLQKSYEIENAYFLDDRGFNCIAFVSNSAIHERDILNKKNIETTEIQTVSINHKNLDIFFVRGHNGELVEVISIQNRMSQY